ncbi:arachidonate 5-lipoxygenase [Mytilus galloprovincialis]|uniref:Arachidonate 5-lipoxygenase n=1 Tax=Mytilus galloprovincialis TaxID=29158 RepID=A0A8B6GX61_MYTGA|nr:arachidonate 5-lipoxygenase [Mytilus galloprovincialis]
MTCPLALFHYEEETGRLMPIAIQLFQEPSETNPVFYPSDPEYTWMLAKMWYSLADSTYHQALTHLNFTHLMMEGISVSAKRQLAPSHPIMRLINPHFLYLMAINSLALDKLINVGGFIDRTSNAGLEGHFDIMRKSMEWWRLDQHGNLRTNLQIRGVFDNDSLGDSYYFRDDALLLYDAIELYVRDYVGLYYTNNQLLVNDNEIQSWGTEMVTTRDQGGLGILGVPNNGNFENSEQLVETLTPIIYMCSVGHAAANFQQYDEYGSPFNYPYSLSGKPPQDKTPVTEKTILNTIANKAQLLELMSITKILSDKTTQSLGDFEENLIVDPPAVEIVTNFQTNLANVGRQIDNANRERRHPYMWLHPEHIPNAISI